MSNAQEFDYIVVGGGTAGCVLASRLSQALSPSQSVLMIEAGPDARNDPRVTDPLRFGELESVGLTVDYSTTPQEHLDGRRIHNLGGIMVSGSSGANASQWSRPSVTDFEVWAERAGHPRWRFENLVQYMNRSEHWFDAQANAKFHGFDGPIHTSGGYKRPMHDIVRKAFQNIGFKDCEEPFGGSPLGITPWMSNIKVAESGVSLRQHSGNVYDLSKVNIVAEAMVRRVILEKETSVRATGVELADGRMFRAKKEVIISCGALKTPQLLMLSGIGPKDELEKIGIAQMVNSPEVGSNLWDHLTYWQNLKLKDPERGYAVGSAGYNKPEYMYGLPTDWLVYDRFSTEDLGAALQQDDPNSSDLHPLLRPDRVHFLTSFVYFTIPSPSLGLYPPDGTRIMALTVLTTPTSRGQITLSSKNPADHPVIDQRFLSTAADRCMMRMAVRRNLEAAASAPLNAEIAGEEIPPGETKSMTFESSDEEIDARIRKYCHTIYHPAGTAAIGKVVDAECKVKGVEGLRVVDASIFPEPICTMPQSTVYGVAEMISDVILGKA